MPQNDQNTSHSLSDCVSISRSAELAITGILSEFDRIITDGENMSFLEASPRPLNDEIICVYQQYSLDLLQCVQSERAFTEILSRLEFKGISENSIKEADNFLSLPLDYVGYPISPVSHRLFAECYENNWAEKDIFDFLNRLHQRVKYANLLKISSQYPEIPLGGHYRKCEKSRIPSVLKSFMRENIGQYLIYSPSNPDSDLPLRVDDLSQIKSSEFRDLSNYSGEYILFSNLDK